MTAEKTLVLVVDDDEAVRESLKFSLELEGLGVGLCKAGEELVEHPHLPVAKCLVLDFKMPEMDGIAVIEAVRALGFAMPAIIITGHSTAVLRQRAADVGAHAVLQKPLIGTILFDCIRQAIHVH
ncbi:response regulator [Jiella avicenniae]|uniref:Response regulator n=1 Tax=Jiella avicenniae TaxID=2907202 RepID=A0A9X1T3W6_9HYPH|nr:response regulator [Jiella avicenniae]MCE7028046.1 response regulator [Jiella avicenniae]